MRKNLSTTAFHTVAIGALLIFGCASQPLKTAALPSPSFSPKATVASALPPPSPVVEAPTDEDQFVADLRGKETRLVPALPWLGDLRHILYNGDRQEIVQHFEALQGAGVREILARVEDVGGRELCALFVVALPKDSGARKKIFELHNRYLAHLATGEGEDEAPHREDKGQHYLVFSLD